ERVADAAVLDRLLEALDDASITVRFSLVGALARAAGGGAALPEAQRQRLQARLEGLLLRDPDPGGRSRAAPVVRQCATPAPLPALWRWVEAGEGRAGEAEARGG